MYTHINSDINFEENIQISKPNKNNIVNLDDNSIEKNSDSGDSTPLSNISSGDFLKNKNKSESINNSIKKITSMLQLGTRSISDNISDNLLDATIIDDEHINETINKHFEDINNSCDNIIQCENTFPELSIQPENINKEQNEL